MLKETNDLFSEDFFMEELRSGYKVSSRTKKIWAVELELLSQLLKVCDKYCLKVYADGGTLLGAVRHDGFIPWDDDIDVVMFRDDYNKLCKAAEKEFTYPFFFQTEQTDHGSLRGHAQLRNCETTGILRSEIYRNDINQGIFIDIFPFDAVPDSWLLGYIQRKKIRIYSRLCRSIYKEKNNFVITTGLKGAVKKCVLSFCQRIGDYKYWFDKYEKECMRYNDRNTIFVAELCLIPYYKKLPRKYYHETLVHKFEMLELVIPAGYKEVLHEEYGDWKIYKIENSLHGQVLFDPDVDYKTYIEKLNVKRR